MNFGSQFGIDCSRSLIYSQKDSFSKLEVPDLGAYALMMFMHGWSSGQAWLTSVFGLLCLLQLRDLESVYLLQYRLHSTPLFLDKSVCSYTRYCAICTPSTSSQETKWKAKLHPVIDPTFQLAMPIVGDILGALMTFASLWEVRPSICCISILLSSLEGNALALFALSYLCLSWFGDRMIGIVFFTVGCHPTPRLSPATECEGRRWPRRVLPPPTLLWPPAQTHSTSVTSAPSMLKKPASGVLYRSVLLRPFGPRELFYFAPTLLVLFTLNQESTPLSATLGTRSHRG